MTDVPDEVRALAVERDERRRAEDFTAADALRDRILELGFSVIDGPAGPSLEPVEIDETARLRPRDVESLLDDVPTPSGYVITPVVGLVAAAPETFRPSPVEVAEVFEVPVATLRDPAVFEDRGHVERWGRRKMMMYAAAGQFFCYCIITICIRYNEDTSLSQATNQQWAKASIAFFFLYYVFFGIGWQGVPWVCSPP